MIVPDSIEPYIGWKALRLNDMGELFSPQQTFLWTPKQRCEAQCGQLHYHWQPVLGLAAGPPRDPRRLITPSPGGLHTTSSISIPNLGNLPNWESSAEELGLPDPPKTVLPEGMHWSWEPFEHEAATSTECACGIYMLDNPAECFGYIDYESVLVQVYGWGNVIRGSRGARVQYAYPKLIIAPKDLAAQAERAADMYGVPFEIQTMPKPDVPLPAISAAAAAAAMTQTLNVMQKQSYAIKEAHQALNEFNKQFEQEDCEPVPLCVKAASVTLLGAIGTALSLIFTYGTPNQGLSIKATIGCLFATFMFFLVDYLTFVSKKRSVTT